MVKKASFVKNSTKQKASRTPSEQIEAILKYYKDDKPKARIAVEEQARRIWLQYLFQQHTETTTTVETEEVEERQQIFGGGNPDGEIITTRKTKKTTVKTVVPRTPIAMIKAALTLDWSVNKKYGEMEALNLCVEAGLMPETVLDVITEYATGMGEQVLESRLKSANPNNELSISETVE